MTKRVKTSLKVTDFFPLYEKNRLVCGYVLRTHQVYLYLLSHRVSLHHTQDIAYRCLVPHLTRFTSSSCAGPGRQYNILNTYIISYFINLFNSFLYIKSSFFKFEMVIIAFFSNPQLHL